MARSPEVEGVLEERLVGDISDEFYVPAYQRGYRWGKVEVRRLLDDIWESKGKPYHLQPIVVGRMDDGRWELVDGQQRLTTLYLIFQFMLREGLQNVGPAFSLDYETRPGSRGYLQNPTEADSGMSIDHFHILEAYKCINAWFDEKGARRQNVANKFYGYLFDSVKVIWYEAAPGIDAKALFTRLNVGRIPLTDAELVKALLLSRSRGGVGESDRAQEIAAQWDGIERDLRSPEVWAFVTGGAREQPTHIGLILDTIADGPTGRERPLFHTFETLRARIEESPQAVWNDVVDLHSLILGWYEDRSLYHKIGYLVSIGDSLAELVALARDQTKSNFGAHLDTRIGRSLKLSASDVRELSYERTGEKCSQVLLLMNVETVRRMEHSSERYSFRAHAAGSWSLEHIHAQSAETLHTACQWAEWLHLHSDALKDLPLGFDDRRDALVRRIGEALSGEIREHTFRELEREVSEFFTLNDELGDDDGIHSIANLALLQGGDNSALSNSAFEVKRREILARDRAGSYIPVCTRNAFLKYYTEAGAEQIHFWGSKDRDGYLAAMLSALDPYLAPEGTEP